MKMMLLTDSFLPHMGGSRVYYYNLYKAIVTQYRDEVTILTKKVYGWEEFDRKESQDCFRIFRRGKPLPSLKYWQLPKIAAPLWDALRILRRERMDVIHVGDLYPQGVIGVLTKLCFRIPCVVYCHGEEITQSALYRFQPVLRNWIYRHADALIANSEFTRNHLLRIGMPDRRIHLITPGVDCCRFYPGQRNPALARQYGLEGKLVVLTVARLVARKGHASVLQAVARLLEEFPNLVYLVVGVGPDQDRLRRLAGELGLRETVIFAGCVAEEALPQFLNLCDVFAMPNYEAAPGDLEGFGMVFLEANAAGKPVIGGRSGGTIDAVVDGKTGLLVNAIDIDEVASALKRLLQDVRLRANLASAGLERVRAKFNWESRAQALRQISYELSQSGEQSKPRKGGNPPPT
jgi:phosphatidylinositol alpha-1,6-mannosyltransferase